MRIHLVIFLLFLIAGSALFGFFILPYKPSDEPIGELYKERLAPDFVLKDYLEKEVKLSDFRGKAVIVNSWASWCPFCVDELPDFVELQEEFGDTVVVIAVNRGEGFETAKAFLDKVGTTGKMIFLSDPSDSFYSSIGGFSMPETIFIDRDGFIKDHKRGPMKIEEMRRRVQQIFGL